MGNKFLLALLTLSAFLFAIHAAAADGSAAVAASDPDRSSSFPARTIAVSPSAQPSAVREEEVEAEAEAPAEWESRKLGKHHSSDKSVAGGGVIIGGLVTAIFAAVYCYIRVTRRKHTDTLT